jgi:SAM-dependent methyltransferase
MARSSAGDSWAALAAVLPQAARAERERPFWQALVKDSGWHRVVDAGCGAGFHLRLLRELGVDGVGFDAALTALVGRLVGKVVGGDLLRPPLRDRAFDASLCLGNTFSLLPSRTLQREGLAALARLTRPGGMILLQGENAGELTAAGPVVRTRRLEGDGVHLRVFERVGRRVRMLAGIAREGHDAGLEEAWLLPTSPTTLGRTAHALGLVRTALPAPPPTSGAGWWAAFSVPSP